MSRFAHLYRTTTLFSLISFRSRSLRSRNPFLIAFFLLCSDVKPNPGPTTFTLCTLNIRSIVQTLRSAALCDLIDSHHPDLFCLAKTWIKPTTTFTELKHYTPPNYTFLSFPRTYSDISSLSSGGGTGFLIREPFTQLPVSHPDFSSFESSNITLKLPHTKLSVFNIYRPPPSATRRVPFSKFLDEFSSFLSLAATTPHEFIITGDFNIHLDNPTDTLTSQFLSVLSSFNLTQQVDFPTHDKNHILDLVITSSDSSLAPFLFTSHWSPSDYFPIFTKLSVDSIPTAVSLILLSSFNRHQLFSL